MGLPVEVNNLMLGSLGGYTVGRSLRFRSSASASLSRTPSVTSNQRTWTWSGWVKRGKLSDGGGFFCSYYGTSGRYTLIHFNASDQLRITGGVYSTSATTTSIDLASTAVYRDPSAWYHIVIAMDSTQATASNRTRMYVNGVEITSFSSSTYPALNDQSFMNVNTTTGYYGRYDGSTLFFDGYIAETNFIDGQQLTPSSFGAYDTNGVWQPKKYSGTYGTNGFYLPFSNTGNTQNLILYSEQFDNANWTKSGATITANSTAAPNGTTTADTLIENTANSSHYAVQTATITASTITTASVYAKANGRNLELDLYSNSYVNYIQCLFDLTNGTASLIGSGSVTNSNYSITSVGNGWYRCVVTATLGSATTANLNCYLNNGGTSSYLGNGTSGIYLWGAQLEQQSTAGPYYATTSAVQTSINCLGSDLSGGNISSSYNNWTPNNISLTGGTTYDSMIDSPTNSASSSNYAVMNPLDSLSGTASNGNLLWTAGAAQSDIRGTIVIPSSGKFYMECTVGSTTNASSAASFGLATSTVALNSSNAVSGLYQLYASSSGYLSLNGTNVSSSLGVWTAGDILQIAVDVDNTKMWLGKNNTWYDSSGGSTGNPSTGANATSTTSMVGLFPFSNCYSNNVTWNMGQRPFSYTPPTGYSALNTYNLPTPTIANGAQHFDIVTRAGTGASVAISSYRFAPDFVWIKSRTNAYYHKLLDKARGANKVLSSNATDAESTETQGLMSFDTNGYTLGTSSDSTVNNAGSGQTYVDWAWKGGGTAVTNNSGTITSTVSANTTAGFSVVTWSTNSTSGNATIGHGLGVTPNMIIMKDRSFAYNWDVYHSGIANCQNGRLVLNDTSAFDTTVKPWGSVAPTSSVFTMNQSFYARSGDNIVAYCFAAVRGYSAMGSYVGTGSSDGAFVYTGFRPRFIMWKNASFGSQWILFDTSRSTYNISNGYLEPNTSDTENTASAPSGVLDILSNGFKLRTAGIDYNDSSYTYVYAAFAENPFNISRAR